MQPSYIDERERYLLKALGAHHPNTPVVLVEAARHQYSWMWGRDESDPKTKILQNIYESVRAQWGDRHFYVKWDAKMWGSDGGATRDGIHANDLGAYRMADVLAPVVKEALDVSMIAR